MRPSVMLRLSYFQTPLLPYVSYLHHVDFHLQSFAGLVQVLGYLCLRPLISHKNILKRSRHKGQSLIAKPQPSGRKHSLSARSKTAMSFCAPCVCPENQSTTCHLDSMEINQTWCLVSGTHFTSRSLLCPKLNIIGMIFHRKGTKNSPVQSI